MLYSRYRNLNNVLKAKKLEAILSTIKPNRSSDDIEDLILLLAKAKKESGQATPLTNPFTAFANKPVDVNQIGDFFTDAKLDMGILFSSISELETELEKYISISDTDSSTLDTVINELISKLGDLRIFASSKHSGFTSRTFEYGDIKEAVNSGEDAAFIDSYASALTLAWDNAPDIHKDVEISIGAGSNGNSGLFIGDLLSNSNTQSLTDEDPRTAFTYSRTARVNDNNPLNLLLEFNFKSVVTLNNLLLEVSANEEGSPEIASLSISQDGQIWIDALEYYKNSPDLSAMLRLGVNNSFNPTTRSIYFPPTPTLFARLQLRQPNFVPLADSKIASITVKNCLFRGIKYKSNSVFTSTPILDKAEIVKVAVLPVEKYGLFSSAVEHQISPDGENWNPIDPLFTDTIDAKNLLSFNLSTADSIATEQPVNQLAYQVQLKKGSQLSKNIGTGTSTQLKVELFTVGATANKITLAEQPVPGTLTVFRSLPFNIGGTGLKVNDLGGEEGDYIVYRIPVKVQEGQEEIFVNGRKWIRVESLTDQANTNNGLVYLFDYDSSTLVFGKNASSNPKYPKGSIEFRLKNEIAEISDNSTLKLRNYSNKDSSSTRVFRIGKAVLQGLEELPIGQRAIELQHEKIIRKVDIPAFFDSGLIGPQIIFNNSSVFTETQFLDGTSEFILNPSAGYSIDTDRGKLYLRTELTAPGFSLAYPYLPKEEIQNWRFDKFGNQIKLIGAQVGTPKTVRLNNTYKSQLLPKYLGSIRKQSVKINNYLEIDFQNGKREFVNTGLSLAEQSKLFSIDYSKNEIYFFAEFTGNIRFEYAGFEVNYSPTELLKPTDFELNGNAITVKHGKLNNLLVESSNSITNNILNVIYDYYPVLDASVQNLTMYETPIVFSSLILTLNKNQLLGTL